MILIETSYFTRFITELIENNELEEKEYRVLQYELTQRPKSGKVIPGSGGIRKLRWGLKDTGKRGGLRIIYYWITAEGKILLLFGYKKTEQEDLTSEQIKVLKELVERELQGKRS